MRLTSLYTTDSRDVLDCMLTIDAFRFGKQPDTKFRGAFEDFLCSAHTNFEDSSPMGSMLLYKVFCEWKRIERYTVIRTTHEFKDALKEIEDMAKRIFKENSYSPDDLSRMAAFCKLLFDEVLAGQWDEWRSRRLVA